MLLQREILRRRWELACRKYPLTTWGSDASPLPPRVPLLLCFQHSPTLCPLVLLSWWMSRPFICPSSLLDWFGIFRGQCTVWATVRIRSSWTGLIWIPLSGFHTLLLSFTRVLTEHVLLWASVCLTTCWLFLLLFWNQLPCQQDLWFSNQLCRQGNERFFEWGNFYLSWSGRNK